jgi:hypothetical protein
VDTFNLASGDMRRTNANIAKARYCARRET